MAPWGTPIAWRRVLVGVLPVTERTNGRRPLSHSQVTAQARNPLPGAQSGTASHRRVGGRAVSRARRAAGLRSHGIRKVGEIESGGDIHKGDSGTASMAARA